MQTITITHEHLIEARRLVSEAHKSDFTTVCILAVAAREADPTVSHVGWSVISRVGRPALVVANEDEDDVFTLVTDFDAERDAAVAERLPLTIVVTEASE